MIEQNYEVEIKTIDYISKLSPEAIVHLFQKVLFTSKIKQKITHVSLQNFEAKTMDLSELSQSNAREHVGICDWQAEHFSLVI